MALTQIQIIQSLGEAMTWFDRELNWGVPPTELRHLIGRIGELYAALITNGQMATEVNQKGYDVVSGDGERISVKTTAISGTAGHVSFNANTLALVDRVIILQVNTDEMQIDTLLNEPVAVAQALMSSSDSSYKQSISLSRLKRAPKDTSEIPVINQVSVGGYDIHELESGTILVWQNGQNVVPARPVLTQIARSLAISTMNANGNLHNTRQLGSLIIRAVQEQGD